MGSKALDFASDFNALGISVQLGQLHRGSFVLANKKGRVERICRMFDRVADQGTMSQTLAAEIQGHLNFAGGFFTSKALRFLVSCFSRLADLPVAFSGHDLRLLCELSKHMLQSMPARKIRSKVIHRPLLDIHRWCMGSRECFCWCGVYDPFRDETIAFEIAVPTELVELWLRDVGDQIICQIEMFAYIAVRYRLHEDLLNKAGIAWIDNDPARYAILKGASDSFSLRAMCRLNQQLELESPSLIWYERVSSYSNPSDGPSRKLVSGTVKLLSATECDAWVTPNHVSRALMDLHSKPLSLISALTSGGQSPVRCVENSRNVIHPRSRKKKEQPQLSHPSLSVSLCSFRPVQFVHVKAVSDFSAISHMSIVSFKFAHFSTMRKELVGNFR